MKKISDWEKAWSQGFAAACAITIQNHGCTTEIEDTFSCNFMDEEEMRSRGVDEYDIEILKPVINEIKRKRKLNLKIL